MADRFNDKVRSVTKALIILETLANYSEGLSLNALSLELSMNKPTVYRLLTSLLEREFVVQDPITSRYSIGRKVLSLTSCFFQRESDIRPIVRLQLSRVSLPFPHDFLLSQLLGGALTVVDCKRDHELRLSSLSLGDSLPLHCTAMGKIYLTCVREQYLLGQLTHADLQPYTPQTITSLGRLREHLKLVTIQNFATDVQEYEPGIASVAVPIYDYTRNLVASLGICYAADLSERRVSDLTLKMLELSQQISDRLGYHEV